MKKSLFYQNQLTSISKKLPDIIPLSSASNKVCDGITAPRTSESHPLKISWIFPHHILEMTQQDQSLKKNDCKRRISNWIHQELSNDLESYTADHIKRQWSQLDATNLENNLDFTNNSKIMNVPISNNSITQSYFSNHEFIERIEANLESDVIMENNQKILLNTSIIHGNFALSSCPGKKVRLNTGPINGRAMVSRDLSADFARIASQGISTIIWY